MKRRRQIDEGDQGPGVSNFLVCYNTLAFKLLVLFVFLTSLGRKDPEAFRKAVESFPLRVPHITRAVEPVRHPAPIDWAQQLEDISRQFSIPFTRTPTAVTLHLPVEEVFLSDEEQIRAPALPSLLAILTEARGLKLFASFTATNTEGEQDDNHVRMLIARSGALVRLFEDTGFNSQQFRYEINPYQSSSRKILHIAFGPSLDGLHG